MTGPVARSRLDARTLLALVIALIVGIGVALIDSRPGFDDTGVTAVLLVAGAAVAAGVSGRSPWLWAVLVGIWTPAIEMPASGSTGSLLALAFAGVGAAIGYGFSRGMRPS